MPCLALPVWVVVVRTLSALCADHHTVQPIRRRTLPPRPSGRSKRLISRPLGPLPLLQEPRRLARSLVAEAVEEVVTAAAASSSSRSLRDSSLPVAGGRISSRPRFAVHAALLALS